MGDIETIITIIFVVFYIVNRFLKSKKQQNPPQKSAANPQQTNSPQPAKKAPQRKKAFSFEDILKEFEKNLSGEEYVEKEAFPVEEIVHEKPVPEIKVETSPKGRSTYKGSTYSSGKAINRKPTLDYGRNINFKIEEEGVNEYVEMLRNPKGFRDAVVLNEIINRKYF